MFDCMKLVETLNEKGFKAQFVSNSKEAQKAVLELVKDCETLARGGSNTLDCTGIYDALMDTGKRMYYYALADDKMDADAHRCAGLCADAYITSTNSITMQGELINIDGLGNRVAAMIYGPKRIIVVCGKNKIVSNQAEAMNRIKTIACPQNARRLGLPTPCAGEDKCLNCPPPYRMCRATLTLQYPPMGADYHIIIIDEEYGF